MAGNPVMRLLGRVAWRLADRHVQAANRHAVRDLEVIAYARRPLRPGAWHAGQVTDSHTEGTPR